MGKDNTIEAFFALVRAGLWETEVQLTSYGEVDYADILRLAQEQAVVGLVAAGFEHVIDVKVPQQWALQFAGQTIQLEQRNKAMNQFIADLVSEMRNADIYTLLVKGQGIAECYERPQWRISGDIDFFLSDSNYEKAKEFLVPRASSVEPEGIYGKHLGMVIDGWSVELHGNLRCGLSNRVDKELEAVLIDTFNNGNVRSWNDDGVQVFMLGVKNDAFYVFNHFLGHFYKGGIGLRQICDWCRLLWIYRDSLNYGLLEQRIKSAGLMSEWKAFGALAIEYLGFPKDSMPLLDVRSKKEDVRWRKKADRIMEFILKSGNMGHNRDMTHFSKYPYLIRKFVSMGRRIGDLINHARIFPLDSLRFFPRIMFNGVRSAMRGE